MSERRGTNSWDRAVVACTVCGISLDNDFIQYAIYPNNQNKKLLYAQRGKMNLGTEEILNRSEIEILKAYREKVHVHWLKTIDERQKGMHSPRKISDNLLRLLEWLDSVIGEWNNRPILYRREPLKGYFYQAELRYIQALCLHENGGYWRYEGGALDSDEVYRCVDCGKIIPFWTKKKEETTEPYEIKLSRLPV